MRVERFALGVCVDASEGHAAPDALWKSVLSALSASDIEGMAVYGGLAAIKSGNTECLCYICAFTGGSLRRMRRVYKKLLADKAVAAIAYEPRPFVQSNTLADIEGLTYYGCAGRDGSIAGGDMPFYKL